MKPERLRIEEPDGLTQQSSAIIELAQALARAAVRRDIAAARYSKDPKSADGNLRSLQ